MQHLDDTETGTSEKELALRVGAEAQGGVRGRLSAFFGGYRPSAVLQPEAVALLAPRAMAMFELLRSSYAGGLEPWASMFVEVHGDHWLATAEFISEHQDA